MNRREVIDNLKAEDPDVVVDLLDISTDELIAKFPAKVARYVANEANLDLEDDYDD
jgi:chorismate mutase